jgi:beta-lactamase class A
LCARVAGETVSEFFRSGLTPEGLSIALIDLSAARNGPPGRALPAGAFRRDAGYYPASVVKIFFLAYYEEEVDAGRLAPSAELKRAVRDMIVVSSNDATSLVVDAITRTTSGPEIADPAEWERWRARRSSVTDRFRARGYEGLNASQKTFCEDAYGREHAFRDGGRNANRMTAGEAARLFKEIVLGEAAGARATEEMLELLSRSAEGEKPPEETEQSDAWSAGKKLPRDARLWAKSGDAYDVHHLVGRVSVPGGPDFVLAVFTKGVETVPDVIPAVYAKVAAGLAAPRR